MNKKILVAVAALFGFFAFGTHQKSQVASSNFHPQMISPIGDGDGPDSPAKAFRYMFVVKKTV